jgi:aquaporin NIP
MHQRVSSSSWTNHKRQLFSEMFGTYLLVFFGPASIIESSLLGMTPFEASLFVATVFGTTVASVIVVLGRFSGAHINPAISVGVTVAGMLGRELFLPYVLCQIVGGLLAGATLEGVFGQISKTNLGSTELARGMTPLEGLALEATGTFVLAMAALMAGSFVKSSLRRAILVGGTLSILILFVGPLTGASFNPARSLGPSVFSGYTTGQVIYYIGPVFGATCAGLIFGALKKSYDTRNVKKE